MAFYNVFINILNWFIETIGVAVISLFIGFILANGAARLAGQLLSHAEVNRILSKLGIRTDVEQLLVRLVKISAYTITCLLVLWHLGILWYVFVVTLAVLMLFCVAEIIVNMLDIIPNIFFCIVVRWKRKLVPGAIFSIDSFCGRIRNVYLTEITITTPEGEMVSVPYVYMYRHIKN